MALDKGTTPYLLYGKIVGPPKGSLYERLDHIYTCLPRAIPEVPIVAIAVEQLNSFRGAVTTRQLAGVDVGVQYLLWKKYGIEATEMNTRKVKEVMTGSGAAKKIHMVQMANSLFGLNLYFPPTEEGQKDKVKSDEDIADSIGVSLAFVTLHGDKLKEKLDNPKKKKKPAEGVYL